MVAVLQGVRVLDFGRYVAGPFCASLLGDLGADVIRVERLEGGEDRFLFPVTGDGTGSIFLQLNRNKRGLAFDPRKPEGAELQRRLVATADVVIANLPPQVLAAMRLDYATLCEIKPDIVLTSVNAFGREGPWGEKLGFDGLAQAMSGNLHLSGTADAPTRSFAPYVDYGTASLCAYATLAALVHRDRSGEGQHVEGALLKTALTFMNGAVVEQEQLALDRVATLNRSPAAGPADVFATRDGWVMCMAIGPAQFASWCRLMGAPELLEDERFCSDESRGVNGELLSARMAEWCAKRTSAEALEQLEAARVPAGPVYSPQQVLDDPHVQALGFHEPVDYPTARKPIGITRFPVSMSATPGSIRQRAPEIGEHSDEILRELGYDDAAVTHLHELGVV
jgi:crotonobetainyl-CoA:carnitine CoA-transferase CaiB-like acyl-CoA transferase